MMEHMADKKILVVDDHFEMLEFLRSMLELSNKHVDVLAVPSAEEGLMEMRRMHFDLLITDVRLPGMSGFDLVRKTKAIKSDTPIIMITAYSTTQERQEAEKLGVFRYFPKPLDTDEMITAVQKALSGEGAAVPQIAVAKKKTAGSAVPRHARKRLESLRSDTGAAQLVLAKVSGQIVLEMGAGHFEDSEKLARVLADNLVDSFLLARELGNEEPFTLQYHAGNNTELYLANVGQDYFLGLFFDIQIRRGRIGTVWVFTQRAIKDLLRLLPKAKDLVIEEPQVSKPTLEEVEISPETAVVEAAPPIPIETPQEAQVLEPESDTDEWLDIEPEKLVELLASTNDSQKETRELNAFWADALSDTDAHGSTSGFSLEEAKRKGLIPGALDFDDQSNVS